MCPSHMRSQIVLVRIQSSEKIIIMKQLSHLLPGFVLILVLSFGARAQQPDFLFERPCPFPITHTLSYEEIPVCGLLDGELDGCYILDISDIKLTTAYETDSVHFQPLVLKVSPEGEIVGELSLGFEGRYSNIIGVVLDPNDPNCCYAFGKTHDNNLHCDRPYLAKFDHDLNLLWQKEIELPEYYRHNLSTCFTVDNEGNFFCMSMQMDPDIPMGALLKRLCYRLTSEGELDGMFEYPYLYKHPSYGEGVFMFTDGSGDYGCVVEEEDHDQVKLARFNRNLELVGHRTVPMSYVELNYPISDWCFEFFVNTPACIPLSNGSMIVAGSGHLARYDYTFPQTLIQSDNVIGFLWVNPDDEVISCATVGERPLEVGNTLHDSIKVMGPGRLLGEDAIYFSYLQGGLYGTDYDYTHCFVVGKMDLEGNVLWRRYWDKYQPENGMRVYTPQSMAITSDDGCLISGYSYYSDVNGPNPNGPDPQLFVLKVFADGTLSVGEEDTEVHMRPYRLYPNPVGDQLHLQFSPDVTPENIELIDLQGRLVSSQSDQLETVGMEGLPAGVYTLRVTLSNGTVYSDKVVKQ